MITLILSGFSGMYLLILVLTFLALKRLKIKTNSYLPFISVIIAARNEKGRIEKCLDRLTELDYPKHHLEIILADDASTDGTRDIIARYCEENDSWQAVFISEKSGGLRGKKNALRQGTALARGEIIFVTDADCMVPEGWLREMVRYFEPGVAMVMGFSPLVRGRGFRHRFLEFDNLFSVISIAVPAVMGFPNASAGRNLAYRKEALIRSGGYEALKKFKSGDDTHLTERFRKLKLGRIEFCAHPKTFVETLPPEGTGRLFQQQIRKNSKLFTKTTGSIVFSILFFLAYISVFAGIIVDTGLRDFWWLILAVRFMMEFICLQVAADVFSRRYLVLYFPLLQFLYPFYIILFNLIGAFQKYKWKK